MNNTLINQDIIIIKNGFHCKSTKSQKQIGGKRHSIAKGRERYDLEPKTVKSSFCIVICNSIVSTPLKQEAGSLTHTAFTRVCRDEPVAIDCITRVDGDEPVAIEWVSNHIQDETPRPVHTDSRDTKGITLSCWQ